MPSLPKIDRDLTVDVAIVGGGITGLTTAYLLAMSGRRVVVLERAACASIDTGHTSAHLTVVTDERLSALSRRFGASHAQAIWDAGFAAIAQIDAIVRAHDIDCDFEWVNGYLHAPSADVDTSELRALEDEAALAEEMGFDSRFEPTLPFVGTPGVIFEHQARIHPRKYLAGVIAAVLAKGGHIFEQTNADEFCAEPRSIVSNGFRIRADDFVIATHNPLVGLMNVGRASLFQTKLALYTTYVVAGRVPPGTVTDALFWDTADPYHYLRVEPADGHDVVIFGGEDHKTGQVLENAACYERLEQRLRSMLPSIELSHRWSGQVIETPDGIPYIGKMTDHQYATTGFAGNGLTFGTIGAMMISDALTGKANPWTELFDPDRSALRRGAWDYLKENVDYPYYKLRERFAGGDARSLRSVKRGEGAIIDGKDGKVAAYRDPSGEVTKLSANCTHMGCVVGWNTTEHTWDCPCHGSRFEPRGGVIAGPAESPLGRIDE